MAYGEPQSSGPVKRSRQREEVQTLFSASLHESMRGCVHEDARTSLGEEPSVISQSIGGQTPGKSSSPAIRSTLDAGQVTVVLGVSTSPKCDQALGSFRTTCSGDVFLGILLHWTNKTARRTYTGTDHGCCS